jgi:CBS domain-containing protein
MTRKVVTVRTWTPVAEAMELLVNYRFTGLPVIDDAGKLVGIVSESDFIAKRGERVADIMTKPVIHVDPGMDLERVAELLLRRKIRRVPVVEDGKLVGLISRRDMLSFMARTAWVCQQCGHEVHALHPPDSCSRCQSKTFSLRQAQPK